MADTLSLDELNTKHPDQFHEVLSAPSGKIHFELAGKGPLVVLVHGVSGPLAVWDKTLPALHGAGYSTLRLDLFGRGFSERVKGPYDLDLFERELSELLQAKAPGQKIRLVGSSFGCVVSTEFALRHPDVVEQLLLIGPAGFPIQTPMAAKLQNLPLLGEWIAGLLAYPVILKQNKNYFVAGELPDPLREMVEDHLKVPGTLDAIRSTMKNAPVQSFVDRYKDLGRSKLPVTAIWGRQDVTFPYENSAVLRAAVPQLHLVTVENAGHLPEYERPDITNTAILQALNLVTNAARSSLPSRK